MTTRIIPLDRPTRRTRRERRDGRLARSSRRWLAGIVTAVTVASLAPAQVSAQAPPATDGGNYVTTTVAERGLDLSGFSPACIRDAPFINYAIVPTGFVPESQNATIVVKDRNGTLIETLEVTSFTGSFIYPGAAVDAQGNATDWPGWKRAADGSWDIDPSDAFLREGLILEVTVNPTGTTTVGYPPATSGCAGPSSDSCVPGQDNDGTPGDDCVPCTPGQNDDGTPGDDCTPCTPGQNNDGDPADDCTLPRTGGGPGVFLAVGAFALVAGLLVMLTARRRRDDTVSTPSGA